MPGEGYRILLGCRRRSEALRACRLTFDQIAGVFALDHAVSPLRLYRYAHGRTAGDVVAAYNDLDPAGTATLRAARFYDYEAWPQAGRRPGAAAVAIFARVYQTTARRLVTDEVYASYGVRDRDLIDQTDHRHLDAHYRREVSAPAIPGTKGTEALSPLVPVPAPARCADLLRAVGAEEADVKRRELLFELALVLGGTPALGLLRHLTPQERERLAVAARHRGPIDAATIDVLERLTARLWAMDEASGPQRVLPIAEAKRVMVDDILKRGSLTPSLRERLLRLYWSLSHLTGWCHYDLMDYTNAARRYQEGLAAGYELGTPALLAHLHGLMADMAIFQGKPTMAIDHAFAAEGWAKNSGNALQQAATFSIVARVLSNSQRSGEGLRMLDHAVRLAGGSRNGAELQHLFWLEPDRIARHAVFCLIKAGQFDRAIVEVEQRLAKMGPGSVLVKSILQLEYATVLIKKQEIPAAATMIDKAAQAVVGHSSARLVHSVQQTRARLAPWEGNRYVQDLDERLRSLAIPA
ncbi:hypothetical protein [Streptosporangium amethystogenes]|uniref:hypothetical protein n=1 Tax=Streptosporangium amethystogenes TaxID=2002 RepID=UPI0004C7862B|nr:hypothetical protein [Streptosporangium amethystogenes]